MTPSDDDSTRLLFVEDEPAPAEFALLFGSGDPEESDQRAARAAELFHAGLVPNLLLSSTCAHCRGYAAGAKPASSICWNGRLSLEKAVL